MEKNFELLRPFDLEAAKAGEAIIDCDGDEVKYIAGPHKNTYEIVVDAMGDLGFLMAKVSDLRMAPLAWVEGRPVYKGDVLWHRSGNQLTIVAKLEGLQNNDLDTNSGWCSSSNLTWTPPKVKREVKLLAYLDADQLFWLRETAQPKWPADRVPSEDRVIEVEEPAC